MKYESSTLFYFSGTGNAEKVCLWIASSFAEYNINASIHNISKINRVNFQCNSNLIGFCAPTHGFNFPPVMMHFILKFPRSNNQSAFIVNTRAGLKMGKIFLPGLSGLAQYFYALILIIKGYKIVGMRSIDLPSNWISIHPGLKEKVVFSIFNRCKNITISFAKTIANGGRDLRSLYDIIQDILISPISIGYYLVGRFVFAKSFYANSKCTSCLKCIYDCPISAIKEVDSRPYWTMNCESCMHCINNCPVDAIQTAHGFIVVIMLIANYIGVYLLWSNISTNSNNSLLLLINNNGFIKYTIESVITLLLLLFSYRVFHHLLKYAWFQKLTMYTSLTTLKNWRRYKVKKIKID